VGNALSHKLEVGERRSLASHYTLTTAYLRWTAFVITSIWICRVRQRLYNSLQYFESDLMLLYEIVTRHSQGLSAFVLQTIWNSVSLQRNGKDRNAKKIV